MKLWIEILHTQKKMGIYVYGTGKKIVCNSKLKLWIFFWGHGEQEWLIDRYTLKFPF